jgi:hypothetical protein
MLSPSQGLLERGMAHWSSTSSRFITFHFVYFRSSTRRRFPLQFDLIVINGGTDKIF